MDYNGILSVTHELTIIIFYVTVDDNSLSSCNQESFGNISNDLCNVLI